MSAAGDRDDYGLVGHPVAQSLSPDIHAMFAAQTGEALNYTAIDVRDRFEQAVREFFRAGGRGLNVTVPHKGAAYELSDRVTMRARVARAVNTLRLSPDCELVGDTTDGAGLLRDLTINLGIEVAGRRVLLVGAGGAARGVIAPLLAERPSLLTIANRTAERAGWLAGDFAGLGHIDARRFEDLGSAAFDLVINATSVGLAGGVPALPPVVVTNADCYDMIYAPVPTHFCRWAGTHGARRTYGGIGMLVEQAADSFAIWRDCRPDTAPVIAAMSERLGQAGQAQ